MECLQDFLRLFEFLLVFCKLVLQVSKLEQVPNADNFRINAVNQIVETLGAGLVLCDVVDLVEQVRHSAVLLYLLQIGYFDIESSLEPVRLFLDKHQFICLVLRKVKIVEP